MISIESNIGRRIQALRVRREMSQRSLARRFKQLKVPVSRQILANYECGRNHVPARFIPAIAHALGVPITEILLPITEGALQQIQVRDDSVATDNQLATLDSNNTKPVRDPKPIPDLPNEHSKNLAGPQIRLFREERGWTQHTFAKLLRRIGVPITRDIIANIETQRCPVTDCQLVLFAKVLGVMPEALLPDRSSLNLFIRAMNLKPQPEHPLHTRRKRGSTGNPLARVSRKLSKISKWLAKLR